MISIGSKAAYAYDVATGKEVWRIEEPTNHSGSTVPVVADRLVFLSERFSAGTVARGAARRRPATSRRRTSSGD